MIAPAFAVDGAGKRFGEHVALTPLSLEIRQGETVAIVGPSGSGKTTLLNLLGGVLAPSTGSVSVLGRPFAELQNGRARAVRVGMMHQQFDLVPNLAVVHNVLAGNLGRWSLRRAVLSLIRPQERAVAVDALRRVGLAHKINERTGQLSGGEQQRVALARLLVQSPHALLADEPVSSLDPARAEALVELLVRMATEGGHTLVASLHVVDLALRHFGRVIALREGVVLFDCHPREIAEDDLALLYALETDDVAPERTGTPG